MDINAPILNALTERMRDLSAKQQVIARNVANADTPGFQSRALVERDFSSLLATTRAAAQGSPAIAAPQVAIPKAMGALGSRAAATTNTRVDKGSGETKPNGNSVVLEDQLMTLADTQMLYAGLSNLYKRQQNFLKIALGRGR